MLTIERMLQAKRALEGTQYREVDFVFVCGPPQAKTIEYLNAIDKKIAVTPNWRRVKRELRRISEGKEYRL